MPQYKLIFFDAKGLGETIRWLFCIAGKDFEDHRVEPKDWPEMKPKMPFNQLPVLEVDGKPLAQTKAICRYLAKEFGLVGKDRWEEARGDMIVDCVDDLRQPVLRILTEKDEERRKMHAQLFRKEQLPQFLRCFDRMLKENNDGEGYFVGDKITWSDVVFATTMSVLKTFSERYNMDYHLVVEDKHPKLAALVKRVEEHPAIADWIEKHPPPEPPKPEEEKKEEEEGKEEEKKEEEEKEKEES